MSTPPYHIEIDNIDRIRWNSLLCEFSDASLYQAWEFAGLLSWTKDMGHVVLKSGDAIVGCCQLRLRHFPFIKAGIADISAGPLCVKKGGQFNPEAFLYLLRKIKEEYGIRRGYMLRIWPYVTGEQKEVVREFLESEGFRVSKIGRPYRTFRIDLSPSLEDLRLNLVQKWRNYVNKAEKNDLKIIEGTSDDLFGIYIGLAEEMCKRKKITIRVNYHQYREIQKRLPDALKMRVMVCESSGNPMGAIVCSTIGDTGIYLLAPPGRPD
jgi:hypothetical protein